MIRVVALACFLPLVAADITLVRGSTRLSRALQANGKDKLTPGPDKLGKTPGGAAAAAGKGVGAMKVPFALPPSTPPPSSQFPSHPVVSGAPTETGLLVGYNPFRHVPPF
jgi:hypothetical protein